MDVRELLRLEPISLSIKRSVSQWFGHVEHKDDAHWLKWCLKMEIGGTWQRGFCQKAHGESVIMLCWKYLICFRVILSLSLCTLSLV